MTETSINVLIFTSGFVILMIALLIAANWGTKDPRPRPPGYSRPTYTYGKITFRPTDIDEDEAIEHDRSAD